jgi:adenylate kinase
MNKVAIILYGPPGAGKGTQANLLADKLGLIHFDTGKFLEAIVHDPKRQKEKTIRRERSYFDGGKLMTPSFVTREVLRGAKRIADAGWGLVFSGSPRTMYEAEHEYPVFEKLFGKKNILIFVLGVPPAFSLRRNSAREVCKACGYLLIASLYPTKNPKICPVCGGPFYRRSLDKPDVIKIRLREYQERTFPIYAYARKKGYKVIMVDGRPAPYKVTERIYAHVKKAGGN